MYIFFFVLLTLRLSIILVINKPDAKILLIISLLYVCTSFDHYVLIIRRSKLYYTALGIITLKQVSSLKLLKYNSRNTST